MTEHAKRLTMLESLPSQDDPPFACPPDPVGAAKRKFSPIGKRVGRLTVLHEGRRHTTKSGTSVRTWICVCSCGNFATKLASQICDKRHETSCGCARVEKTIARCTTHGRAARKNRTPEYSAWKAMRKRCSAKDENNPDYPYWAARGIVVCERWDDFSLFLQDMGVRPSPNHSIDRVNNDGNYEPGNCRWATPVEQRRNQRRYMDSQS